MGTGRPRRDSGSTTKPATAGKEMTAMYQLTQLAGDRDRERLAHAEAQRPAQRLLALARATRRAERAERRMRRAARQAQRLRAQLQAQAANDQ
jgi:hypothetical protein